MPFVECDLGYVALGSASSFLSMTQIQLIAYSLLNAVNYMHSASMFLSRNNNENNYENSNYC